MIGRRGLLGTGAAMVLAAEAGAQADALAPLYEAARAAGESQVVLYGAYSIALKPVWDLFQARFPGINVIGNPVSGAQMLARLDADFAAGRPSVDIIVSGTTEILATIEANRAEGFTPPGAAAFPPICVDPQGRYMSILGGSLGIVYNTDRFNEATLPRQIGDLLDPRYKGAVVDDPLANATTTIAWIELFHAGRIDAAWMQGFRRNATVVPSIASLFNALTTGTVGMIPFGAFSRYLRLKEGGAKVGFLGLPGLVVPTYVSTMILKGAPHGKAARLFQAWCMTPEAQAAIVTVGKAYAMLPGVPVPEEWPVFEQVVAALPPTPFDGYAAARTALERAVRQNFK